MKKLLLLGFASLSALFGGNIYGQGEESVGLSIGGGYLKNPETGYFLGKLDWNVYEDADFAHHLFLELLYHQDDSTLEVVRDGTTYIEDGDINFTNLTFNYAVEAKISQSFSAYAGAGLGMEFVSVDNDDVTFDDDSNFLAQMFAGVKYHFNEAAYAQLGARYLFRDDFSLLDEQFITEDTWGFDLSFGVSF